MVSSSGQLDMSGLPPPGPAHCANQLREGTHCRAMLQYAPVAPQPLLSALRRAAPGRVEELAPDELECALAALWREAAAAWPRVVVEGERFVEHLAVRAPGGGFPAALAALHSRDLYLACALEDGDDAAAAVFRTRIVDDLDERIVPAAQGRLDEVRQRVCERLLVADGAPPRIASYRGHGALHAWVRVTAARIALDLVRAEPERSLGEAALAAAGPAGPDPELAHVRATTRAALASAIERAAAQLSVRERTLLRLSLLDELTIDDLAALYRVHRATAARWLSAARDGLGHSARRELAAATGLAADELTSALRLLETQIDLSWSRFLM